MEGSHANNGLERTVASDQWRNTLSRIPSVFGRLVYLAGLPNSGTGRYEHQVLAPAFGGDEADCVLKRSHSSVFAEWLAFNIEQQKADLDGYLSALDEDKRTAFETWFRLAPYLNAIPNWVTDVERRLYLADLIALTKLLENEYVADPDPSPATSRPLDDEVAAPFAVDAGVEDEDGVS